MKLTIVEKNLLSWTAMHIDFVMCKNVPGSEIENNLIADYRGEWVNAFPLTN